MGGKGLSTLAHLGFSSLLLYSSLSTSDSSCGFASLPKVSIMEQPTGLPSLRAFSAAFFSAPVHITSFHGRRLLTTGTNMKKGHRMERSQKTATKGGCFTDVGRNVTHPQLELCIAKGGKIQEKKRKVPERRPTDGQMWDL